MKYDVAVIGGGVVGSGVARDAALRGLKTVLIEKKDLAGGTTGACMGMIHGGVRYLLYDYKTTKLSCIDAGYIANMAPFLIFRIPFLTPILKGDPIPVDIYETFFEAYDRFVRLKSGKKHTRLNRDEALLIEPGLSRQVKAAVTLDEWGIDVFRLCVLNALSAAQAGASILNHHQVTELIKDMGGRIIGLKAKNMINGSFHEIRCKMVVNAAGPWAPKIADLAGTSLKLRPGKGVNIFFEKRLSNVALTATAIDGRQIAMIPHENSTMLGCTDDDFYDDLDNLTVNRDEIEYLLQGMERVFPAIRQARMIRAMAGVRPTLYKWGPNEDKLSREHELFDHEKLDGAPGFVSIVGGKLATYRIMAQDTIDLVCRKLGVDERCTTHLVKLPGAETNVDIQALAKKYKISLYALKRMFSRHGAGILDILQIIEQDPTNAQMICNCEPVLKAEILHCIKHEYVLTLDDIRRRTRLGCGPCQGMGCAYKAGIILGEQLGWSWTEIRDEINRFLQERWKGRRPVLRGVQLNQEQLYRQRYKRLGLIDE